MEAGRELDALVATEVMGLDVPGWAVVMMDPECCVPWHGNVMEEGYPEDPEGKCGLAYARLPVFTACCGCDLWDERDTPYNSREVLGHHAACLEPVPFYSADIAAAWEVHCEMREQSFSARRRYAEALREVHSDRLRDKAVADPPLPGDAVIAWPDVVLFLEPIDFCLAALEAKGVKVE